mmetsp:Transcript_15843/g.23831  ORF Transcript_15843/g.23831 Transcript_15843/m.23831 type:complete len:555 (+) Transcript_15843:64-1728(+)
MNTTEEINFRTAVIEVGATYRLIVPRITGSFSLSCSLLIVYMIFRSSTQLHSIYHRLIFGMSIGDILASTAMLLSHMAVPREGMSEAIDVIYTDCPERFGSFFTCATQGFFFLFGTVASHLYTASLCWFYYFVMVKAMSDSAIRKKIEPYLHSVPAILAFLIGMVSLASDNINPGTSWCTSTTIPWFCSRDNCERGSYIVFTYIIAPILLACALCALLSIVFCLASVYKKVRSLKKIILHQEQQQEGGEVQLDLQQETVSQPQEQEQRQDRKHHEDNIPDNPVIPQSEMLNRLHNGILQRSLRMTNPRQTSANVDDDPQNESGHLLALRTAHFPANRNIAFQALAYVLPFSFTALMPLIRFATLMLNLSDYENYLMTVLIRIQLIIQPLQGFFNLLIFLGFKIYHQKHLNPTYTLGHVVYKIFFQSTADPIFISRITIVEEGGNVTVRVEDEELLSIDNASLGNMNNVDDGLSTSSGVGISLPSPYNSDTQREVSEGQQVNNASGLSGLSGFHLSSGFSTSGKDYSGHRFSNSGNVSYPSSYGNCVSDSSTVKN